MIFCSFSCMKSYALLKTEQKLTEVRMEMSFDLNQGWCPSFFLRNILLKR